MKSIKKDYSNFMKVDFSPPSYDRAESSLFSGGGRSPQSIGKSTLYK
jgi:hypothetical protein